jgi:exodeoxyribonuclease VII large subunit
MSILSDTFSDDAAGQPHPAEPRRVVWSVSELTSRIRSVVESAFPFVWVHGEVSNVRIPASGHLYFTLKDQSAQISAVMFRGQARQARFVPEDGMSITGLGRLSVYEARGSYQIVLEYIEPAGIGALQLAFEKLKRRLAEKGFFDASQKKPLPFLPKKISLITSPSGAVVHDLITVISRRFSSIHIQIIPARVQGVGAEDEIVQAISLANSQADSDVIVLARGGGSLEDLQAFNSEPVAVAIHGSRIPVVSAIGHETDVTIADFVADLRAPTPSVAGELVVPEKLELSRRCRAAQAALEAGMKRQLMYLRNQVHKLMATFRNPRKKIQEHWMRLDDLSSRLDRLARLRLRQSATEIGNLARRLSAASPRALLRHQRSTNEAVRQRLSAAITILVKNKRAQAMESILRVNSLDPLAILKRGYSVTRILPGLAVVTRPEQVRIGSELETRVAGGRLICTVKGTISHGQENL